MKDNFSLTIPYPPRRWIWMLSINIVCFPTIIAFGVILFSDKLSVNDFRVAYAYSLIIYLLSPYFWYSISAVPISIIIERDKSIVLVRRFFWTKQYIFDHLDDFVVVKDYITEQYSSELPTTVVLYNFFETNKDAPDSIVNSMKVVAEDDSSIKSFGVGRGYDFIYASKDYVVFWTDETLQDGLLYSENIRSAVKATPHISRYSKRDKEKLPARTPRAWTCVQLLPQRRTESSRQGFPVSQIQIRQCEHNIIFCGLFSQTSVSCSSIAK